MTRILNAFTIDVEGFFEANVESFPPEASSHQGQAEEDKEIEVNTEACLNLLSEWNLSATFFFLGRIARDIPQLVRSVADAGHEIGCHGDEHRRIYGLKPEAFREGLLSAKKRLEDVSGQEVRGFRAPDFSITSASLWALDVLQEAGFLYDSSIYPIGVHDVYGIGGIQPQIHRHANGLIEFPLATATLLGKRFPFGGGGYFRLYPVGLTLALMRRRNRLGHPCMFYIHPYEVGPTIPHVSGLSALQRFRRYYRCRNGSERLRSLLAAFEFGTAFEVLARNHATEIGCVGI